MLPYSAMNRHTEPFTDPGWLIKQALCLKGQKAFGWRVGPLWKEVIAFTCLVSNELLMQSSSENPILSLQCWAA